MPPQPAAVHPAEVIDIYLRICTDEDKFVNQTVEAFHVAGVGGPALDCAVGTGFGTINLLRKGHSIVCSDGSTEMLERFAINCSSAGLVNKSVHARWADLGCYFPQIFDLVMCRGNSLAYADTWDGNQEHGLAPFDLPRLAAHLEGMVAAIRPGGALLVDVPRTTATIKARQDFNHHGRTEDGRAVSITETIDTDPERRLRHWAVDMVIAAEAYRFERSSHLIDTRQVIPILKRLGFRSVVTLPDAGIREHYDSLLAMNLQTTAAQSAERSHERYPYQRDWQCGNPSRANSR